MTDASQPLDTLALLSERIMILRRDYDMHDRRLGGIEKELARLGYIPQQLADMRDGILEIKAMVAESRKLQDQRSDTSNQNMRSGFTTSLTLGVGFVLFLLGVLANIALQAVHH